MSPKRKITKKQMKEDRFVRLVLNAREWAVHNLNVILITVGAVVIVIALIWFLTAQGARKEQSAYDLLGRAEMEARSNQAQLAVVDLQKVIDDHGGSEAAKLAAFRLANVYFSQNEFEKAEQAFRDYLDSYLIDELSRISALEGIAASLSGQGKFQEAGETYLEVAGLAPEAVTYEDNLFHAVENFVKAGSESDARQAYELLEKKGITSEKYRSAKILMIENGFLAYQKGDYK